MRLGSDTHTLVRRQILEQPVLNTASGCFSELHFLQTAEPRKAALAPIRCLCCCLLGENTLKYFPTHDFVFVNQQLHLTAEPHGDSEITSDGGMQHQKTQQSMFHRSCSVMEYLQSQGPRHAIRTHLHADWTASFQRRSHFCFYI